MRVQAPWWVVRIKIAGALVFAAVLFRTADAGTLLVYNNNDSGAGSLRQAIAENHVFGGGYTIVFSNNVSGTITLSTGELLINDNVIILGPGPAVLTMDGNYPNETNRVFHIGRGVTVTIAGLGIFGGVAGDDSSPGNVGGGILNDHSSLTVSNCDISDNRGGPFPGGQHGGGGIYNNGGTSGSAALTVINCNL